MTTKTDMQKLSIEQKTVTQFRITIKQYISLSQSNTPDLVVPIMISLIGVCCLTKKLLNHHFDSFTMAIMIWLTVADNTMAKRKGTF
jgi:hypothetical protein